MNALHFAVPFVLVVTGCTVGEDADLASDPELADILDDDSIPEEQPVDGDTSEVGVSAAVECTKQRFLHIANYSFVGRLDECVNGACPNGCWGFQRRTSGFQCDYAAAEGDRVRTRDGGGPFASYNEIKPLNASDATAVANCRTQSGGRAVRTYAVWNGAGWSNEGIAASVKFAELYGTQSEATPHFATWYDGARTAFSPMTNISPETSIDFVGVKRTIARICSATRSGWAGAYFYDGAASGGAGMADWKREAIIRGMNYCTTH
jgi:hypothetical protein